MKAGFHRLHFFFCNFTRPFKGVDTLGHSLPVSTQPGASALFNRVDAGPCLPAGSGFVIFLYRDLFSRVNTAGNRKFLCNFRRHFLNRICSCGETVGASCLSPSWNRSCRRDRQIEGPHKRQKGGERAFLGGSFPSGRVQREGTPFLSLSSRPCPPYFLGTSSSLPPI